MKKLDKLNRICTIGWNTEKNNITKIQSNTNGNSQNVYQHTQWQNITFLI